MSVKVGDTTYFVCKVASKNNSQIVWLRHEDIHPSQLNATNSLKQFYLNLTHKDDSQRLVLEKIQTSDHGWYTCLVTTPQGTDFSSAWLQVIEDRHSGANSYNDSEVQKEPRFTKPKNMHKIIVKPAGNMLKIKCPASGNPTPNITWYKNGTTPDRSLGTINYNQWSIVLEDLTTFDAGNYTCVICNIYGCINSTFKVHVQERYPHRPYIKEGFPQNVTILVNSTAVFHCPLLFDLEPYIEWLKIGLHIPAGETTPNGTVIQVFFLISCVTVIIWLPYKLAKIFHK
ncbi:hypothetical protein AAG570_007614 [Ranatra chinensis]|uniref:receptor protein-tyrosine kinase n=1 Tax=Ranatra chinensis TaxID=642074 RepID=A0ABD0XWQ5_9HEMI